MSVSSVTQPFSVVERQHRILVAEDNAEIRKALASQLTKAGYEVTAVGNGDAAVLAYLTGNRVGLLITDLVMPGFLSGKSLATLLRIVEPDLPVIFISGFPRGAQVHCHNINPIDACLMKPFCVNDLLNSVRSALHS